MTKKNLSKFSRASQKGINISWTKGLCIVGVMCCLASQSFTYSTIRDKYFNTYHKNRTEYYCDVEDWNGNSIFTDIKQARVVKLDNVNNYERFYFVSIQFDVVNQENLEFYFYQSPGDDHWYMRQYENPEDYSNQSFNGGNLPNDIQEGLYFSYNGRVKSHFRNYGDFWPIQFRLLPNSCHQTYPIVTKTQEEGNPLKEEWLALSILILVGYFMTKIFPLNIQKTYPIWLGIEGACASTSVLLLILDYRRVQLFYAPFFLCLTYSNLEMNYRLKKDKSQFWNLDLVIFFTIAALGTAVIYFVDFLAEDWYQLIGMSILIGLSLLYFFKQVCIRRAGFFSFFFSTYSLVIFALPFLAYIDGTFIKKILTEEEKIDFIDAMRYGYPMVVGYFFVLLLISFLRRPLSKKTPPPNSLNTSTIGKRSIKYIEAPRETSKKSFIEKPEVQVNEYPPARQVIEYRPGRQVVQTRPVKQVVEYRSSKPVVEAPTTKLVDEALPAKIEESSDLAQLPPTINDRESAVHVITYRADDGTNQDVPVNEELNLDKAE